MHRPLSRSAAVAALDASRASPEQAKIPVQVRSLSGDPLEEVIVGRLEGDISPQTTSPSLRICRRHSPRRSFGALLAFAPQNGWSGLPSANSTRSIHKIESGGRGFGDPTSSTSPPVPLAELVSRGFSPPAHIWTFSSMSVTKSSNAGMLAFALFRGRRLSFTCSRNTSRKVRVRPPPETAAHRQAVRPRLRRPKAGRARALWSTSSSLSSTPPTSCVVEPQICS